jgi:hypothetical protein
MASNGRIINPAVPNLPLGTKEYEQRYQDQFTNILRLYFNQLRNALSELLGNQGGKYLAFPTGAFYQDGVTTLTTGISNVSTTPIVVASTAQFGLTAGAIIIGTEIISYTGKTATTFTGITRGAYGSTKAAHTAGASVTEAQPVPSSTTATAVIILQTTTSNGVAIDATDKTKLVFETAGIYNIQFSVQMVSYDGTIDDVTLWFRLNGVDIPYSAGVATVPAIHGGVAGTAIISWNLLQPINAGDYLQLLFASTTGNTVCATYAGGTSPTHPVSPSVIITATFVSALPT